MLKVENICKTYDDKIVLNNLSFTVPEGEIYTLVGAFGEGKSTLINIITGFEKPDSGHVYVKGTDCQLSVDKARTLFGYVPDIFPSYGNMTLKEYMNFFGSMMDTSDSEQLKHLTVNLLGFVGLGDYIDKRVRRLNYGQKQKLSIARALLHNPKFIILDEPFYGLNVDQVVEIKDILEFLHKQGRTIFMTSDNLQLSASLSTSVGIMENGTMLYGERIKQAYENIRANSKQVFTQVKYNVNEHEISNIDISQIQDLSMTGDLPNLDMTDNTSDIDMTGSIPNMSNYMTDLDYTSNIPNMSNYMTDLESTSSIPNMSNYMTDLDNTSNIPNMSSYIYQEDDYVSQMLYDEPIQMPYEELEAIEKTKNGENISRRIISKRIDDDDEIDKKSFYDSKPVVSRRGIEEKRGVGGSRVVTDKSKYNKPR